MLNACNTCTQVHIDTSLLISDPHAGVSVLKRSRRGQRAAPPDTRASSQLDLGEPGKERNGNVECM